jgi:ABC-type transporter Mla MlaB component
MPLTIQRSDDDRVVTITISGRFDFDLHQEFRQAFEHAEDEEASYVIDLAQAEYMDSSALGMLLLLRDDFQLPQAFQGRLSSRGAPRRPVSGWSGNGWPTATLRNPTPTRLPAWGLHAS